jgi:hypothetical protein
MRRRFYAVLRQRPQSISSPTSGTLGGSSTWYKRVPRVSSFRIQLQRRETIGPSSSSTRTSVSLSHFCSRNENSAGVCRSIRTERSAWTPAASAPRQRRPGAARGDEVGIRSDAKTRLPRPAADFASNDASTIFRAGDRTRTGDVQLGKEDEGQGLSGLRANFPLKTGCGVRWALSLSHRLRWQTGPGTGPALLALGTNHVKRSPKVTSTTIESQGSRDSIPRPECEPLFSTG